MSPAPSTGDNARQGLPFGLKLVTIVLAVFALLVGGIFIFGRASSARWYRLADSIHAKGDPLTFEEIEKARTPIPDEQNSALVIQRLLTELGAVKATRPDGKVFIFAERSSEADFFTGIPRQSIETSRAFLENHRSVLDEFSVLRDMPTGRFDLDLNAMSALEIALPELAHLRAAAKLHRLDAMIRLIDGDIDGATDPTTLQFALGGSLNEHPTVIGRLVQTAIHALAKKTVEDILRVGTLDDRALRELLEVIDRTLATNTMRWAFLGERAVFVGVCNELVDGRLSFVDLASHIEGGPMVPFLPEFFVRENQSTGTRMLTWLVDAADDPLALDKAAKRINKEVPALPVTQIIVRTMLPSLSRAVELHHRLTAELLCTKAALAAERFRLATGELPSSFDDFVPAYLDAVPIDPCSGDPILFTTNDEGIVIYSISNDLVDNGGIVARQKKRPYILDVGFRLLKPEHRGLLLIDAPEEED